MGDDSSLPLSDLNSRGGTCSLSGHPSPKSHR
ncbi:Uncharacterised protein [Vibrio cholerae]|nr:Uncharacterised protein [Vibrio cholerae]